MRALLITVGSRGDAEPFCSLASALGAKGHHVDIFLQTDLTHLAPSSASVHDLPFTQIDFYKFVGSPTHGVGHKNPRVRFVGIVTDVIAELTFPCSDQVLEVAKSSQVIVCSSLARPLAMALSTKLSIPACVVHLQPLAATDKFPHYSQTEQCVSALTKGQDSCKSFEETYWELEGFQHEFLQDRLDVIYNKLGMPPLRFDKNFQKALTGQDNGKTLIANAFSSELIPNVHHGTSTVDNIGPLADAYIPDNWSAPADLVAFLGDCDVPPVCIGYGSMPFAKAAMVLEALQELDRKAVLVGDTLKAAAEDNEWVKANVFQVSSAPYAWLLPQCSMMLSHGGAGVVNSTLRAGIPCVISPFMGDQFFHAKLLEAMELGVQAGDNLGGLTKEDIAEGIKRADGSCKAAAKSLGEKIKLTKTGVDRLVAVLEARIN